MLSILPRVCYGIFLRTWPYSIMLHDLSVAQNRSSLTRLSKGSLWQILFRQVLFIFEYPVIVLLRNSWDDSLVSVYYVILYVLWNLFTEVFHFLYPRSSIVPHQRALHHGALPTPRGFLPQELLNFSLHTYRVLVDGVILYRIARLLSWDNTLGFICR